METTLVSPTVGRSCRRLDRSYNNGHRKTPGFDTGWALALHRRYDSATKTLIRSEQGELVNRMKYYHDMRALNVLVEQMKQRITDRLAELGRETSVFDAIIPIPPSIQNRPFQPVIEIARRLAEQLSIRFDADLVSKQGDLQPMKNLESYEEKVAHLRQVLKVADTRYAGKRLLVIDDIVDSGATLDTVASLLKTHGAVGHVYVLCATETLMKR